MKIQYFSHDINAANDYKIIRLRSKLGAEGYGIYWMLIELLYQNNNALPFECDSIAYALQTQCDKIESVVRDFGLFEIEDNVITCPSISRRLTEMNERSEKAKRSAEARWNKSEKANNQTDSIAKEEQCDRNANALQTQCEGNAINKIKENKINNIYNNNAQQKNVVQGSKFKIDDSLIEKEVENNLQKAVKEWVAYKRERGQGYRTLRSFKTMIARLKELSGGSGERAYAIVSQSIANNWAGLFALKNELSSQEFSPKPPSNSKEPEVYVIGKTE
jgi:uncharacterized protein YdaU (DUF1376 family)